MVYTSNIPQAPDNPSNSQELIKDNFNAIASALAQNHTDFNSGAPGQHNFLQMPVQGSSPTVPAGYGGLWARTSSLTSRVELAFQRPSEPPIEFTGKLAANNGWTRLPSGILLKWGIGSGSGTHTTNFPTGGNIPVFSNVFIGVVTTLDTSATPNTFATFRTVSNTGISVHCSSRTSSGATGASYTYLVIGI